ncbi:MAG: hypothetical protein APF76_11350 [Desulfitibacter sp. BRH_c19]|nr:MAG: hypothetical protein APF76_11350 [Desulfitibacter sp. BRH_c19]
MFEKRDRRIIFVCLAIIIFLSMSNSAKMKEMQNRINYLQSEISNISMQVSNEVSGIRGIVADMREQERWWTPAQVQVEDLSKDEAVVRVKWQLRDYQEDSRITFNYRDGNIGEFTEIEADKKSNGYFTVRLPIDPPKEPIVNLQFSQESSVASNGHSVQVEEKVLDEPELSYEYYISSQTQGSIRNSDVLSLNLWEITYGIFSPINADITILQNGNIRGMFHWAASDDSYYKVQEVYLEARNAGNVSQERWFFDDADLSDREVKVLHIDVNPGKDYHSLYLVIKYNEGLTVERRING